MGQLRKLYSELNQNFASYCQRDVMKKEEHSYTHEEISKSFRTGRLERKLQMVYSSLPLGAVVSLFCESV
jgi:hypothetical protein